MSESVSQEERDKFEMYLFEMSLVLQEFIADALKARILLDYSLDSLDALEELWLAGQAGADAEKVLQRSVRYFGEVFRRNVGGKWQLSTSNPQSMYFKFPVIAGYAQGQAHLEFCPLFVFNNFTKRERKGTLRKAVEADLRYAQ